jgi:hypothetical protein
MSDMPDHVISICASPQGTVLALTCQGRIFERVQDSRDFATGPRHTARWLWREIPGPLAEGPD